jgi:TP901 family phage tail tape measure protein
MPETYLSLILKASKTGTGVTDATRELKDFEKTVESVRRVEAQAAAQHLRMAEALKGNASIANVTKQSFAGLEKELQAGSLSVAGFEAATRKAGVQAGLISQASLKASTDIGKLNAEFVRTGDVEKYAAGLRNIQRELQASQSFMERYGAQVKAVAVVGLAALAVGFADVVKTSSEFEKSMSRIVGLTNTTRDQLGSLTGEVLKMSGEVGRGPKELADALYFISSSGYQGAAALKVLEASAKASAAGLGDTKTIADAVTSSLKAYGLGADEAGHFTDMFIQIVKEGKGEPGELADVLGRGLPIAKAAGISFEEMGASIATMTLTGMDAAEAMTSFRGTVSALEAPGKQARDALKSVGLSADELRANIREKGLLVALQDLMDRTGGNIETLDLIIPNIRALTGVLSSAGSSAEEYAGILGRMKTTTGQTADAFATAAETMAFKSDQAGAAFDSMKISVGNMLLPVLKDLMVTVKSVVDSFLALDPNTQKMIVSFGALALSAAPAMIAFDKAKGGVLGLVEQFRTFQSMRADKIIDGVTVSGKSLFQSLSALKTVEFGVLIAGLTVIMTYLGKVSEAAQKSTEDVLKMANSGDVLEQAAASTEIMAHGQDRLRVALDATHEKIKAGAQEYADYESAIKATAQAAGFEINAAGDLVQVYNGLGGRVEKIVQANYLLKESNFGAAKAYAEAEGELDRWDKAAASAVTASKDMASANGAVGQSAEDAARKQRDLTLAVESMTAGYGGAVAKEMSDYNSKQDELKAKAADLAAQIKELEAVQGMAVATTKAGTLTADERAAAETKLGAITEDLTLKQRKKNETDKEFAARMAGLQVQADKLTAKLGSGGMGSAIVDNSEKIADLKAKYDEATGAINENAAAHDEAMKRIVLDIAQQQLAQDGWTQTEITAFTSVAQQMGVFDQASATLTANVLAATGQLAADGNAQIFATNLTTALDTANNSAATAAQQVDTNMAGMAASAAEHSSSAAAALGTVSLAAQTTADTLITLSSKEIAALPPVEKAAYEESLREARQAAIDTQIEMGKAMGATTLPPVDTAPLTSSMATATTSVTTAATTMQLNAMQIANDPSIPLVATNWNTSMTTMQTDAQTAATSIASTLPPALLALATDPSPETFAGLFQDSMSLVLSAASEAARGNKDLQAAIDGLKSKTITITTIFKTIGSPSEESGSAARAAGGAQFGGQISRPTWVGEAGPELFFPQARGYVMDNADSMRLIRALEALAAQRTGSTTSNEFNMTVNAAGQPANIARDFAMLQALAGA